MASAQGVLLTTHGHLRSDPNLLTISSKNQYTRMLRAWGVRKNCNGSIWKFVDARIRKRKSAGKTSDVYLNGNHVPPKKVQKEIARHVGLTNMYYEQDGSYQLVKIASLLPHCYLIVRYLPWLSSMLT